MPKALERKLLKAAHKIGLHGKREKAYIYGTLRKIQKLHEAKHPLTYKK